MQNGNQIDLNQITDMDELRKMYIDCNEQANLHREQAEQSAASLLSVRQRMAMLQQEEAAAEQAKIDEENNAAKEKDATEPMGFPVTDSATKSDTPKTTKAPATPNV